MTTLKRPTPLPSTLTIEEAVNMGDLAHFEVVHLTIAISELLEARSLLQTASQEVMEADGNPTESAILLGQVAMTSMDLALTKCAQFAAEAFQASVWYSATTEYCHQDPDKYKVAADELREIMRREMLDPDTKLFNPGVRLGSGDSPSTINHKELNSLLKRLGVSIDQQDDNQPSTPQGTDFDGKAESSQIH